MRAKVVLMRSAALVLALCAPVVAVAETKAVDCFCTDTYGSRVELGGQSCLVVNGHAFLARCEMALNVTIWRETGTGCVSSGLDPGTGGLDPGVEPLAVDAEIVLPEAQS